MQTKGNSKKKNRIFLGITILVFLASALICSTVQTSGFTVEARDVNFMTDDGVMMAGTLYIPQERHHGYVGSGHPGGSRRQHTPRILSELFLRIRPARLRGIRL